MEKTHIGGYINNKGRLTATLDHLHIVLNVSGLFIKKV